MDGYFDKNTDYTHLKGSINGIEKNIYFLDGKKSFESFNIIDTSYYLLKKNFTTEKIKNIVFNRYPKNNPISELIYFDLRYYFGVSDITNIIEYDLKKNIDHYIKNLNNDEKKKIIELSVKNKNNLTNQIMNIKTLLNIKYSAS